MEFQATDGGLKGESCDPRAVALPAAQRSEPCNEGILKDSSGHSEAPLIEHALHPRANGKIMTMVGSQDKPFPGSARPDKTTPARCTEVRIEAPINRTTDEILATSGCVIPRTRLRPGPLGVRGRTNTKSGVPFKTS